MRETDASPSRELRPAGHSRVFAEQAPEPTAAPSLFASSSEPPRRQRGGLSIWLAAAAALVFGIGLGFASGYRAARVTPTPETGTFESPAPTSGAGQPFSESPVQEPLKLNPEPIVPAQAEPPGPRRGPEPVAGPGPQPRAARVPQKSGSSAVRQVPPTPAAREAAPPTPASGPGSLEVLSRPAGAQVVMDGRSIGKTPMTVPDVPAGEHSIRLELPGFKGWATTTDVKAGSSTRVAASLEQ